MATPIIYGDTRESFCEEATMKKILFGILIVLTCVISASCGSDPAPAAAAASGNALPQPSVNCGGNDCL